MGSLSLFTRLSLVLLVDAFVDSNDSSDSEELEGFGSILNGRILKETVSEVKVTKTKAWQDPCNFVLLKEGVGYNETLKQQKNRKKAKEAVKGREAHSSECTNESNRPRIRRWAYLRSRHHDKAGNAVGRRICPRNYFSFQTSNLSSSSQVPFKFFDGTPL